MRRFGSQYEVELALDATGRTGCTFVPPREIANPYDVQRYIQSVLAGWQVIDEQGDNITAPLLIEYNAYRERVRQQLTDTLTIMADTVRDNGFGALYRDTHG